VEALVEEHAYAAVDRGSLLDVRLVLNGRQTLQFAAKPIVGSWSFSPAGQFGKPNHSGNPRRLVDRFEQPFAPCVTQVAEAVEGSCDLAGHPGFKLEKYVVGRDRLTLLARHLRKSFKRHHRGVNVGKHIALHALRLQHAPPMRSYLIGGCPDQGREERIVEALIYLGDPFDDLERPLIFTAVIKGKDILYRARLEPDQITSIDQFPTRHIRSCVFNYGFVEPGRQSIYHFDHAHYFGMLPVSHFG